MTMRNYLLCALVLVAMSALSLNGVSAQSWLSGFTNNNNNNNNYNNINTNSAALGDDSQVTMQTITVGPTMDNLGNINMNTNFRNNNNNNNDNGMLNFNAADNFNIDNNNMNNIDVNNHNGLSDTEFSALVDHYNLRGGSVSTSSFDNSQSSSSFEAYGEEILHPYETTAMKKDFKGIQKTLLGDSMFDNMTTADGIAMLQTEMTTIQNSLTWLAERLHGGPSVTNGTSNMRLLMAMYGLQQAKLRIVQSELAVLNNPAEFLKSEMTSYNKVNKLKLKFVNALVSRLENHLVDLTAATKLLRARMQVLGEWKKQEAKVVHKLEKLIAKKEIMMTKLTKIQDKLSKMVAISNRNMINIQKHINWKNDESIKQKN